MIEFVIPIDPIAKEKPKTSGKKLVVKSKEIKSTERAMIEFARQHMRQIDMEPLSGALQVTVRFCLRAPRSVERLCPTTKPDLIDYAHMMQVFNGILWLDDSQIIGIDAIKLYVDKEPHIEMKVEQIFTAEHNGHKKNTLRGKGVPK